LAQWPVSLQTCHWNAHPEADPERRHIVKGRTSFALSDQFLGLWPNLCQPLQKSFTKVLMRMVA
jgi:hypothetical protein